MPTKPRPTAKRNAHGAARITASEVLAWLEKTGTKKQIAELDRYGIEATRPFGVSVGQLTRYAKQLGRDHGLAQELWASGRYEARMLAAYVDEPERVTVRQMNAWVAACDNWALVDTLCFHLFDRTPGAWGRIAPWGKAKAEFTKRAAFALLWSLSVHDKEASDSAFMEHLSLIERSATDERNFVKMGVDMALRAIGMRSARLSGAAAKSASRLARSADPTARWIGSHALRELGRATASRRSKPEL